MKLITMSHLQQQNHQETDDSNHDPINIKLNTPPVYNNINRQQFIGQQQQQQQQFCCPLPIVPMIQQQPAASFANSFSDNNRSPIEKFFDHRAIFITGSSGFIGKVLLEKLLRCYPTIRHIYLLLRTKRNQAPHERLHNSIFNAPLFDSVKIMDKKLLNKVTVIPGDISQPKLGMSKEDEQSLIDADVSIIFHSAATVKFDDPLKKSVNLNLTATRNMLQLARKLPNLVSLCHVSTAYVNSDIKAGDIEERIYPMHENPNDIIEMARWMEEDTMQTLKPKLLRNRPNTYTYTKALAELLLSQEAQDLPVTIVRPSIVVATWSDPIRGWVDNLNGPTGLVLAVGKGLLRTLHVNKGAVADLIPADTCINLMIAAAWKTAQDRVAIMNEAANKKLPVEHPSEAISDLKTTIIDQQQQQQQLYGTEMAIKMTSIANKSNETTTEQTNFIETTKNENQQKTIMAKQQLPIYHCTSGQLNPITWGNMETLFLPIIRQYPSSQVFRYPGGTFKQSKYVDLLFRLFVHFLPALLVDTLCLCTGNKRILFNVYEKIHGAAEQLNAFLNNSWSFNSNNMLDLYQMLDPRDKITLPMDIRQLHWESFWHDYTLGARRYVLKEDTKTLPQARKFLRRAYYLDLAFSMAMMAIFWYYLRRLLI